MISCWKKEVVSQYFNCVCSSIHKQERVKEIINYDPPNAWKKVTISNISFTVNYMKFELQQLQFLVIHLSYDALRRFGNYVCRHVIMFITRRDRQTERGYKRI